MLRSCGVQPSHKERAIGAVRCKKEGMLLQPLRWCCVDCVIDLERDVREEQHHTYMLARTSNNRVIMACELYCCLLPHCEALRICRSGFPIATVSTIKRNFWLAKFLTSQKFMQIVKVFRIQFLVQITSCGALHSEGWMLCTDANACRPVSKSGKGSKVLTNINNHFCHQLGMFTILKNCTEQCRNWQGASGESLPSWQAKCKSQAPFNWHFDV